MADDWSEQDRQVARFIGRLARVWVPMLLFAALLDGQISDHGNDQVALTMALVVAYVVAFIWAVVWTYRQWSTRPKAR